MTHYTFMPERTTHPRLKLGLCPDTVITKLTQAINKQKVFRQPSYNIDALAFAVGTNRLYLSRIINLTYGMNFNQFINHCRVEYSKYLLLNLQSLSTSQIAFESGFSSPSYFTRIFKAKNGILPKDWHRLELEKTHFGTESVSN